MKGQHDRHVQAWVEDRVVVLRLLEELHALSCKPCAIEMRKSAWSLVWRACGR